MTDERTGHVVAGNVVTAPGALPTARSIPALAATACVRVRDRRGDVVGSGFLVGPDLVATCAHVVATAAASDAYGPPPDAAVAVDFPALPSGPEERWARVHRWVPIEEDHTGDVALLRLAAPAPPGAVMPPVRRVGRLWGHAFRVFGFPEGSWDGVWATGRFRAGQGTGWLQLQGTPGDQPIEGGFSGAPVWDDDSGAVVGMTVAADRDPGVTTAYLISVEHVLGLDPELLPNPYRGLEPFGEEHAEFFFGRDPEVRRLAAALDRHPLVAVAGPSGAGKSSLVRAGLLPRLRADGAAVAQVRPVPGAPALPAVVGAVLALAGHPGDAASIGAAIASGLADPARRAEAVAEIADAVARAPQSRLVLVVDQFEELADADLAAARELLDALACAAVPSGPLRVVLTLRGTALDEVLTADAAEALGPGTVLVGPMDRARLRQAVVRPAERAPGLAFEDGLVERILDDAGTEPGRLPLVESLLAQLWTRREGGSLTVRGYEEAGGVAGAVAAHAEQVVAGTIAEGRVDELRSLCTRLVVPSAEGRFVRRAARLDELPAPLRALVPLLAAGRLVVAAGGRSDGSVELAHQALIEHWPRLRAWLEADRAFLAWRSELDAARVRWEAAGHDEGALLRGAALDAADRWLRERPGEVTGAEAEYVRRSRVRQRREVRRWRVVAAVLAVLVLAAGTLSVVAVRRGNQVAAQLATANAGTLATQAAARAGRDPVLAAELAAVAWHSDPDSAAARTALGDRYAALSGADAVVAGTPGGADYLGVRADGDTLVVSREPGIVFVQDVLGPDPVSWELPEPTGVTKVLPAPDGRRVAVLSGDGALRLWTVGAPAADLELAAPGAAQVLAAGFAPDGTRLGWLTREEPGRATLQVRDLTSDASSSTPLALAADEATLRLTPDPGLVAVRAGGPNAPWALHRLDGDDPARALPAGTTVQGGGSLTSTCEEGAVGGPRGETRQARIVVRDLATDAERHRIELPSSSCALLWYSLDGRYAVDPFGSPADPASVEMIRITDLATGVSYQAPAPPLDQSTWPVGQAPVVTAIPDGDGGLVAFVASGPTVLRIPAEREIRFDPDFSTTHYDAPGAVLVVQDSPAAGTGSFTAYDPATGRQVGDLPAAVTGSGGWSIQDVLFTLGRGPEGWQLDRYESPGLTRTFSARPPTDPAGTGRGTVVSDAQEQVLVVLADGYLSAWDGRTGQRLGEPRRIADGAGDQAVLRLPRLWPREDRPGEVFVATSRGLELWDAAAGRQLAAFDVDLDAFSHVASRGDRLAVLAEGQIQVWDVAERARLGTIPAPDLANLTGFAPDGYLVAENVLRGEVVFWDLERRVQAGSIRPGENGIDAVDGDTLEVNGTGGRMPLALAATPGQWHRHLCQVLPAELSPAARDLLPAGTGPSTGCP